MPRTNATRSPKRGTVAMELLETQETRARDMRVFCVCARARFFFVCARIYLGCAVRSARV
jgi:hypothetical protein